MNIVKYEVKNKVIRILGLGSNFSKPFVDNGLKNDVRDMEIISYLLAHDAVEHLRGIENVGGFQDEIFALGSIAYNRGFDEGNAENIAVFINDDGLFYYYNPKKIEQELIANLKDKDDFFLVVSPAINRFEEVISSSRKMLLNKSEQDLIYFLKHIKKIKVTDEIVSDYKSRFNTSLIEEYLEKVFEGMLCGYYLAHKKYGNRKVMNKIFNNTVNTFKNSFDLPNGIYELIL